MSVFSRILSFDKNPLDVHAKELSQINNFREEAAKLSQEEIKKEVHGFREQVGQLDDQDKIFQALNEIRPRVFALTREAAKRAIGQFHYDVQIAGGMVLADGKIADMKTGEGKTLTPTLPLVLFALAGKGAHLVTVNDYLS